jgi:phosphohistidine phosphatase
MYDERMLNLMIMRHGKSDWDAGALSDHARPLANRGILSAERMGEVIRDLGIIPGLVISSTAVRARATAELARITGGWASRLILDDDLYGTSPGGALDVVTRYAGDCERVMIVGHEPTWSMLVRQLTGGSCAMRTATVADIEMHTSSWDAVGSASGTLVSLLQPRGFLRS